MQLSIKLENTSYCAIALDERCDVKDTAQILIFVRSINDEFQLTQELLLMSSMKNKTTGADLFNEVEKCILTHCFGYSEK